MTEKEFKEITIELAYLTKEIRELKTLMEQRPVELHYHYTFDYGTLIKHLKDKGYI